ncbi:MAG: hypothetical protein AB7V27_11790 [Candidatus Binatia bacterium]
MIRPFAPSPRRPHRTRGLTLALLFGAIACAGGSGSSGFDARLENRTIAMVLEEGSCAELDGLMICPADAEALGTPAPGMPRAIETNLDAVNQTPCATAQPAPAQPLVLCFAPSGFPSTAEFRVAVREVHPNRRWRVLPAPRERGDAENRAFELDVPVPSADAASAGLQIAVLAFSAGAPDLPETVETLGATGADLAFVSMELPTGDAAP